MIQFFRRLASWQTGFLVGMSATLIYLTLLTQQYAGDGLRWYDVISGVAAHQFKNTQHLLYPLLARLYFFILHELVNVPASFQLAQSMNALFGGLAVGCLFYTLHRLTRQWTIALGGSAILAFSRAFTLHATDMTEPMPGASLSLLAIAIVIMYLTSIEHHRLLLWVASAIVGIAASLYQSNVLTVIGIGALILLCDSASWRIRVVDTIVCVGIAGTIALGIYMSAYLLSGNATSFIQAFRMSLRTENDATQGIYIELSLRRAGALVFGLGDTFFGLRAIGEQGTNFFVNSDIWTIAGTVSLAAYGWIVAGVLFFIYAVQRKQLIAFNQRIILACLIWLAPQLLLLLLWGARYSKLWILPLAIIILMLGVIVHNVSLAATYRRFGLSIFFGGLVVPVILWGFFTNLLPDRTTPNLGMLDTLDIAQRVSPKDAIISPWGGTPYAVPSKPQAISLVVFALSQNLNSDLAMLSLQDEIRRVCLGGGEVYFYGLLELSEAEWNLSNGQRLRLPFSSLAKYRSDSIPVLGLHLRTPSGVSMYLWKLGRATACQ